MSTAAADKATPRHLITSYCWREVVMSKIFSKKLSPGIPDDPRTRKVKAKIRTNNAESPIVYGDDSLMRKKAHGTSQTPVQSDLRWGVNRSRADRICNHNRKFAEPFGSWRDTTFLQQAKAAMVDDPNSKIIFYDSNTGKPLFVAPGPRRTFRDFVRESNAHGWPSFRDDEVVWENVRVLKDGEVVSVDGTHLGHNLPDGPMNHKRNRFCINLVSIAGRPLDNEGDFLVADRS